MAARDIVELWRGQNFSGGTPQTLWKFQGYSTSLDVDTAFHAALLAETIPIEYGGLPIDLPGRTIADLGGKVWHVMVPYSGKAGSIIMGGSGTASQPANPHGGESGQNEPVMADISFSVRGGTQHITQSKETLQSAATGSATPRNFGQAIGVNPDTKEVAGVDVLVPEVTFTRNVQIPAIAFTGAYAKLCERAVGKVNSAVFFGYSIREVLCTSITISTSNGTGYRSGTFDFAVKRNSTITKVISADPVLELDDVEGWSYVWTTYKEQQQSVGGVNRKAVVPFEVYEEKVYDEFDFGQLNLEESRVAA